MVKISSFIIPLIVLIVIIYGLKKKTNVYNSFIDGAKESLSITIGLFPTLLAMVLGVNILINSGFINFLLHFIKPFFYLIRIPIEIIPMALMRPISGSASLAILNSIFNNYGPDEIIGRICSIIQGSTDTTFYILSLYFGSVGIKKIKYSLWVGLATDVISIIISVVVVKLFF